MGNPRLIISLILPITSFFIIIGFVFYGNPSYTGMVTYEIGNSTRMIQSDVILKTKENEIVPEYAIIKISLDDKRAMLTVKEFIEKTKKPFNYTYGSLEKISYTGYGYSGNYSYTLNLSDFSINTTINLGSHSFVTEITYEDKILFRQEKDIIVG